MNNENKKEEVCKKCVTDYNVLQCPCKCHKPDIKEEECKCGTDENDIKENGHFFGCPLCPIKSEEDTNLKHQIMVEEIEKEIKEMIYQIDEAKEKMVTHGGNKKKGKKRLIGAKIVLEEVLSILSKKK